MYKIYINDRPLLLMKTEEMQALSADLPTNVLSRYTGQPKFLLHHIDLLEKTTSRLPVIVYANDLKKLWKDFKGLFRRIEAAGGLVYNEEGRVLGIYRRGFWDLPKGKIDKKERKKQAAVREVMEETGIDQVKLERKIMHTWHTYRDPKHGRILKKTHWYRMSSPVRALVPQLEEDIEEAVWLSPNDFKSRQPIYQTILEVLNVG